MNTATPTGKPALPALLALAISGLLLTACASKPVPPTSALNAAEQAITSAEQTRLADTASPELGAARDKLAAARAAVAQEKMDLALRLAEQSRAEADLAAARNQTVKARAVNDDMQKSIDTLKQEMQRNAGAK